MTITMVGKRFDLTPDTLRYYERIGLIPSVGRTAGGIRDYNEEDCRWIEFIKCMRSSGLPIDALIEYVTLFQQGGSTAEARKNILIEQRALLSSRMKEMQNTIARLDVKIERYHKMMVPIENELKKNDTRPNI